MSNELVRRRRQLFCRFGGKQGSISEELIEVARPGYAGGKIFPGRKRAEFNLALALAAQRGFDDLGHARGLGIGIRRLRRPGCDVGKPGQDPKIKCRHAFLFYRLHLQGIIPDPAAAGTMVRKNTES